MCLENQLLFNAIFVQKFLKYVSKIHKHIC